MYIYKDKIIDHNSILTSIVKRTEIIVVNGKFPQELLILIFGYVNNGRAYKNILYTCRFWCKIMISNFPKKRYQVYNQLFSLINKYPDESWKNTAAKAAGTGKKPLGFLSWDRIFLQILILQ